MQAHEIRGRIIAKAGSIENAAAKLQVNRTALSQVINYIRATKHIRNGLRKYYAIQFNDGLLKTTRKHTKRKNPKAA